MAHRDLMGRELAVGDKVACPGSSYGPGLVYGEVTRLTPKQVRVQYDNVFHPSRTSRDVLRYPQEVLKLPVTENDIMIAALKK